MRYWECDRTALVRTLDTPRRMASGRFTHPRAASLVAGALPLVTFPRADLGWLAWIVLIPGMLLMGRAPTVREAALRGWWFGTGYLLAALYWTIPNIGPGLLLVALVFGGMWAGWGAAIRRLVPAHPVLAMVVVPCVWLVIELVRSWPRRCPGSAATGSWPWRPTTWCRASRCGGRDRPTCPGPPRPCPPRGHRARPPGT